MENVRIPRRPEAVTEPTQEMIRVGISTLKRYICLEYEPIYPYEEIVEDIFISMSKAKISDAESCRATPLA
jgi:hypothetical protein